MSDPPPLGKPRGGPLPPGVDAIVARALAKEPKQRFKDAGEMVAALDAVLPRPSAPIPLVRATTEPADSPLKTVVATPAGARARKGKAAAPALAATTPSAPRRGVPKWLLAGAAGSVGLIVLLFLIVVIGIVVSGHEVDPVPVAPDASLPHVPVVPPAHVPVAPQTGDVWSRPSSAELDRLRARVEGGATLGDGDHRDVWRMGRASPHDPRPWLLEAHADLRAGHRSDAIEEYQRAFHADAAAVTDPRMLIDLVHMAAHRHTESGTPARELIVEAYAPARAADVYAATAILRATVARGRAGIADDPLLEPLLHDPGVGARLDAVDAAVRSAH